MRISDKKLKSRLAESGVSVEDLGRAIVRKGLKEKDALSAVRHWLNGRGNSPTPKGEDVEKLASALGCEAGDLRHYSSECRFARISARKARLVAGLIRGKRIDEAQTQISFSKKRAAVMVGKALNAAIAAAEDAEADLRNLVVTEARVDEGPTIKRFQPKDRGRAFPIMKRTCHIHVTVDAR